jgi:hypothetical protein
MDSDVGHRINYQYLRDGICGVEVVSNFSNGNGTDQSPALGQTSICRRTDTQTPTRKPNLFSLM